MKINKKAYKTPSVNTIMLRQHASLLAGSNGVEALRIGYTETTPETWD
jgi:hypothetical protein